MENFVYQNYTKILFGKGKENEVGEVVKSYGYKKILLHYGMNSIKKSGLYDKVINSLKNAGINFVELSGVVANPRISLVREGVKICKEQGIDFILAVGGGSVIDSAKAIGVGATIDGDVWDLFLTRDTPTSMLPVGTILTIPAAGSEASNSSVISDDKNLLKKGLNGACLRPLFSILNPEFCFTLPQSEIGHGCSDMMAHIMERYFTNTKNCELTDELCEATLRTIIKNAPIVYRDQKNYDAWSEIMLSGYIAHNDMLDMGRISDWATHRIEHEVSAIYDIAHGAGLAIIFPGWLLYNIDHDLERIARFSHNVLGVPMQANKKQIALQGIETLRTFYKSIGLPVMLNELKIKDDRFE